MSASSPFVLQWSQLEVDLNAVERVTDLLSTPQEPPQIVDGKRPPASWPSSVGGISIDNLTIRYAPNLPAVIKSLSVEFAPRQRIGLIGRTGSGKSTFATSLLRFVEPSEGKIIIDGIDVCSIGLHDLRSAVTLIPQEAGEPLEFSSSSGNKERLLTRPFPQFCSLERFARTWILSINTPTPSVSTFLSALASPRLRQCPPLLLPDRRGPRHHHPKEARKAQSSTRPS